MGAKAIKLGSWDKKCLTKYGCEKGSGHRVSAKCLFLITKINMLLIYYTRKHFHLHWFYFIALIGMFWFQVLSCHPIGTSEISVTLIEVN